MGLFLSNLNNFKFDSCRLVRSFSACIQFREVDSRLSIGFVVLYRSSMLEAAFSLLLQPNILASIMQKRV